jgi:hypothetical protein
MISPRAPVIVLSSHQKSSRRLVEMTSAVHLKINNNNILMSSFRPEYGGAQRNPWSGEISRFYTTLYLPHRLSENQVEILSVIHARRLLTDNPE